MINNPKRVLVLMSDTGGGHRAAAEAIIAAAHERYPGQLEFTMVDVFRHYSPFPFKYSPEIYPLWVNYGARLWGWTYIMSDAPFRSRFVIGSSYFYWRRGIRRLFEEHPSDLILCVHSLFPRPVLRVLQEKMRRPPFITVVTDLVWPHAFWYEKLIDRCLVPTEPAYERGLAYGLKPEQLRLTGLPVHPNFIKRLTSKTEARQQLGIDENLATVLVVSGGEGMGPLYRIASEINRKKLKNLQLLIIAGRNHKLRERLEATDWNQPTTIFGFVDFMPLLMAASDMIVTKAGPATIMESCTAGLPIIISGAIPGQEIGNVEYVVKNEAGVLARGPKAVANTVESWLNEHPEELQRRAANAQKLARPNAVWEIVSEIYEHAQHDSVALPRRQPVLRRLMEYLLP
ncbi:MAG: glycosyltransferase [Anaerolineae bacterium]|nr:glycosyltransferase [Anaerolineae bacterium]